MITKPPPENPAVCRRLYCRGTTGGGPPPMKPTPTERLVLATARTLNPLTREGAAALAGLPDLHDFAHRHDRQRLAETRLVWAADDWHRRQLRLALYRRALREGDRTAAALDRVTALDTPTARIRQSLTAALIDLRDAQDAAFRLF